MHYGLKLPKYGANSKIIVFMTTKREWCFCVWYCTYRSSGFLMSLQRFILVATAMASLLHKPHNHYYITVCLIKQFRLPNIFLLWEKPHKYGTMHSSEIIFLLSNNKQWLWLANFKL